MRSVLGRRRPERPPDGPQRWRVLVTGAARGIGRGIAERLSARGAEVIGLDRDWEGAEPPAGSIVPVTADLAEREGGELAGELLERFGTIDKLVNNAGIDAPGGFVDLDPAEFDRVMRVNLRTPWFLTRGLVEHLVAEGERGSVLFISSLHSRTTRKRPHYAASKAAIVKLVREMASELGPKGIRVNALSPGWIEHSAKRATDRNRAILRERVPLRRSGSPEDIAPLAEALLDDEVSAYVTGTDVLVDGGLSLHSHLHDI